MFLLPVMLVVRIALFPDLPPIHVEAFESEGECITAGKKLDKSTPVILVIRCEVDT